MFIPRDCNMEFNPQIIKKSQTHFDGFDDKIISLYAIRMTTHEIEAHLQDLYDIDVLSPTLSPMSPMRLSASQGIAKPPPL